MKFHKIINYKIVSIEVVGRWLHVFLEYRPTEKVACPYCSCKEAQGFGSRSLKIMDVPVDDRYVELTVKYRRYRCKKCLKVFQPSLPAVSEKYRMTERLEKYINQKSTSCPFTHLAEKVGVSEGTIRKVFTEYRKGLEEEFKINPPEMIGIYDATLSRKPRRLITNVKEATIVEILKDQTKEGIVVYLSNIEDRRVLLNISIDEWELCRPAIMKAKPEAKVSIDKLHVMKVFDGIVKKWCSHIKEGMAVNEKHQFRNTEEMFNKLVVSLSVCNEGLLLQEQKYPEAVKMYDAVVSFFKIYDSKSSVAAKERYLLWRKNLPEEIESAFREINDMVDCWEDEFYSYFDLQIDESYTRAMYNILNNVDQIGRQYLFQRARTEMLFSEGIHKTVGEGGDGQFTGEKLHFSPKRTNYGVSVEKLSEMINTGVMKFDKNMNPLPAKPINQP